MHDRLSKRTRAIPLRNTSAPFVATPFVEEWVMPYEIRDGILTDTRSLRNVRYRVQDARREASTEQDVPYFH